MFAPKQFLALVAILSSVNAACVHRSQAPSSSPPATSIAAPAYSSRPALTSASAPAAATSAPAQQLTSTLAASSYVPQNVAAASSSSTSSAVAAAATGSSSTGSSSTSSSSDGTKYMVVLGDSYSSTGFYIEGGFPSAHNPIGVTALPGTTTSGGLNWVGYVTSEFNTSLVLTYDWAYYGADVSNEIINTGVTTDVIAQVADFEANLVPAPSEAPWTAENLLVAVWIGINDVGQCYWESAEYTTCPIDDVMTKYFSLMQNMYDDGVRNFVVNTVPPFYKAPIFTTETNLATMEANIETYNNALVTNMEAFKAANADITLGQVFNTTSYFWEVFNDPTSYGLDSDITCANSDGTTCVWYDDYHPGQAIHKLVAQGFVDALTGSFF